MIGSMLRKAQLIGGLNLSIAFVGESDPIIPEYSYTLSWTGGSLSARTAWEWQESTDGTTWGASTSEAANATSASIFISLRNQIRYYRVREVSATENGPWSNVVQAWTQPTAPGTFGATAVSGTQIDLSWKDLSTNETGFVIERRTPAGSGSYSVLATVGPIAGSGGTGTYSDTGLTTGQSYQYRVAAVTPMVNSAYSAAANATPTSTYDVTYLVIAGGGGSGSSSSGNFGGGGGGAGGYREASGFTLTPGTSYTVTVGGGGAAGVNGSNSVFSTITSTGGGRGGNYDAGAGQSGGSGGGGATAFDPNTFPAGGAGTSGQGNGGGTGYPRVTSNHTSSGGGGGAGGAGANGGIGIGGAGGAGTSSSISGSAVVRAGGGGGGVYVGTIGTGGTGGGGDGGKWGSSPAATNGSANTGGGAGGADDSTASGGSGVVILRIPAANYSGTTTGSPTVTDDGSFKVLVFNSSGSYTG